MENKNDNEKDAKKVKIKEPDEKFHFEINVQVESNI